MLIAATPSVPVRRLRRGVLGALWRGRTADVEFYNLGAGGGKTFLCANFVTGQAGTVNITAAEWSDLIGVGDTVPPRIASSIAPRTPVRTYG